MANIKLLRKGTEYDPDLQGYRLTLDVTLADGITSKIFVNQRLRSFTTQNFNDVFVAVATPAQIADFGEDAPLEGSSYFRTNKIDVISRNANYLDDVFDDIIWNVQKLIEDTEAIATLQVQGTYNITNDSVEIED